MTEQLFSTTTPDGCFHWFYISAIKCRQIISGVSLFNIMHEMNLFDKMRDSETCCGLPGVLYCCDT